MGFSKQIERILLPGQKAGSPYLTNVEFTKDDVDKKKTTLMYIGSAIQFWSQICLKTFFLTDLMSSSVLNLILSQFDYKFHVQQSFLFITFNTWAIKHTHTHTHTHTHIHTHTHLTIPLLALSPLKVIKHIKQNKNQGNRSTSRKKLTRYGSDLILAHTVHRNSISSFSVGAAFTSPHAFTSLCNIPALVSNSHAFEGLKQNCSSQDNQLIIFSPTCSTL